THRGFWITLPASVKRAIDRSFLLEMSEKSLTGLSVLTAPGYTGDKPMPPARTSKPAPSTIGHARMWARPLAPQLIGNNRRFAQPHTCCRVNCVEDGRDEC